MCVSPVSALKPGKASPLNSLGICEFFFSYPPFLPFFTQHVMAILFHPISQVFFPITQFWVILSWYLKINIHGQCFCFDLISIPHQFKLAASQTWHNTIQRSFKCGIWFTLIHLSNFKSNCLSTVSPWQVAARDQYGFFSSCPWKTERCHPPMLLEYYKREKDGI